MQVHAHIRMRSSTVDSSAAQHYLPRFIVLRRAAMLFFTKAMCSTHAGVNHCNCLVFNNNVHRDCEHWGRMTTAGRNGPGSGSEVIQNCRNDVNWAQLHGPRILTSRPATRTNPGRAPFIEAEPMPIQQLFIESSAPHCIVFIACTNFYIIPRYAGTAAA
jgi:hypothetical protein